MLIKSDGFGILLIHRHLVDMKFANAVFYQFATYTLPDMLRVQKQQFQSTRFNSHKAESVGFGFGHNKMFNVFQHVGDMLFNFINICFC